MRVKMVKVAGTLIGLIAGFFLFALFTAGPAHADQSDETAVTPVVRGLAKAVEPVVRPVADAAAPVTRPVLTPVTDALSPTVSSVAAVLEPVAGPVVRAANPVVKPVARATASERVISAVSGSARPGDSSGIGRTDHKVRTGWTDRETPTTVKASVKIVMPAQVSGAPIVGKTEVRVVRPGSSVVVVRPSVPTPSAPVTPPQGPAVTGSFGGTVTGPHGPGVDGSTAIGVGVLPRPTGSWRAAVATLVGPSWWTSYGGHHPS